MTTLLASLLTLLTLAVAPAAAQTFPTKPIKAVVPFPAGSATDSMARFIGENFARSLGQNVVVENVPGANGTLGARAAARAPADGYTIFFSTNSTHSASVHLFNALPYDPVKDFAPLAILCRAPLALVVRANAPFKTVGDLVAHAKANPGKLNFGTGNTGSLAGGHMLNSLAGVQTTAVSYRGTPQAVTDLLGGQIDFVIMDLSPTQEHLKAGTLRALAVTSAQRMRLLPDVPTMIELGIANFELFSWNGVHAPAGTPPEVVAALNRAIVQAVTSKEGDRFFDVFGAEPAALTAAEFATFIDRELERWGRIIALTGLPKQ